jgi:hypothetical protein
LAFANRAAENAGVASAHAQQMVDESVAGIQKRVSKALVDQCPQWFTFEQTARHRLYAWRLAGWVAVGASALFIGGGATNQWWSAKESATRQAVLEAVDRIWRRTGRIDRAECEDEGQATKHGVDAALPDLRVILAKRPNAQSFTIYDRCKSVLGSVSGGRTAMRTRATVAMKDRMCVA